MKEKCRAEEGQCEGEKKRERREREGDQEIVRGG